MRSERPRLYRQRGNAAARYDRCRPRIHRQNRRLKAPVKVVTASGGVIGFIGSVWPDKVKAVIGEGIPVQPISIALLAAAVLYFLLLWLLKPGERDEPSNGGTTITTGGPNSPGFGHVGGNVTQHFHAAPAPTQEANRHMDRPSQRLSKRKSIWRALPVRRKAIRRA